MHDHIRTLDLKLYSVLPGGQIYIFLFQFFLQSESLNHIIRKGFTLVRSLANWSRTDDIQSGSI